MLLSTSKRPDAALTGIALMISSASVHGSMGVRVPYETPVAAELLV